MFFGEGGDKLNIHLHFKFGFALPAHKSIDVIVAVIDFQEISQTGSVILHIKLQELQVDPLAVLDSDVPVANLIIFILVWVAWGLENVFGIREDSTTLFS